MPLILQPTRITSHSKTLIDNIFTNIIEKSVKSGNITCSISDHLAQFAILQVQTPNQAHNETELKRDFTKFNKNDFTLDFLQVDMEAHLKIRNNNADYSMTQLLNITEAILDKHAPYKKISKHKKNTKIKSWVTKGILVSINKKNTLYKNFINEKNSTNKLLIQIRFKKYRNLVSLLLRKSKKTTLTYIFKKIKKI